MSDRRASSPGSAGNGASNTPARAAGLELAGVDFGKLPGYLGYQLRQAQSAVFRDLSRTLRDTGVTPGEFSLLALLKANPGINSITLSRVYQLDKATLSLSISRLVKRGLLSSTRHANDRRYYALELTSAGAALLRVVTRHIERQEKSMDAVLGQGEREHLLDLLRRISRAFDR